MYIQFQIIEPYITFTFLISTLAVTLPPRRKEVRFIAFSIILHTIFFICLYSPIQLHVVSFLAYWCVMFGLGLIFAISFSTERFVIQLTLCTTYLSWIIMSKSSITSCFELIGINISSFPEYILFYGILYISLLFCTIFMQRHRLNIIPGLSWKYWICMAITPALFAVFINVSILSRDSISNNSHYTPLLLLLLFFSSLMSYYLSHIISSTAKNLLDTRIMKQKFEMQLQHMEYSAEMAEQIRQEKHEIKNIYLYIQSLLKNSELQELENFIDTKLVHRFDLYEEFQTGNPSIDFLLTQKVNEAKSANISVMTNILLPQNLKIDNNDLYGLLLNLLDNAIEASSKEKHGDIHVSICQKKFYLCIEVKNKVSTNILSDNPHLNTTKKDAANHGIGMKIINSIVQKYNGILTLEMESSYFVVSIMLQDISTDSNLYLR